MGRERPARTLHLRSLPVNLEHRAGPQRPQHGRQRGHLQWELGVLHGQSQRGNHTSRLQGHEVYPQLPAPAQVGHGRRQGLLHLPEEEESVGRAGVPVVSPGHGTGQGTGVAAPLCHQQAAKTQRHCPHWLTAPLHQASRGTEGPPSLGCHRVCSCENRTRRPRGCSGWSLCLTGLHPTGNTQSRALWGQHTSCRESLQARK